MGGLRTDMSIPTAMIVVVICFFSGAGGNQEYIYEHSRSNVGDGLSPYYHMVSGFMDAVKPPDKWAGDVLNITALVDTKATRGRCA